MKRRQWLWLSLSLMLVVSMVLPSAGLTGGVVQAQGDITLTLALPSNFQDMVTPEILAGFEAANPGVTVHVVANDTGFFGLADQATSTETHLDTLEEYVSAADVLYVSNDTVSSAATQAGYFLNLAPLASVDPQLNSADFYPALWQSFQWDGGVWALPVSGDVVIVTYNPDLFDAAGVAYPNDNWTVTDIEYAIRDLTEFEADGTVAVEAVSLIEQNALFRSMLTSGLYDPTVQPSSPQLARADVEMLLTVWDDLMQEGYFTTNNTTIRFGQGSEQPLAVQGAAFGLRTFGRNQQESPVVPTLLPGGQAIATAQGMAVSSGTAYPEQAYALARFLTERAEVANNFFSSRPARQSLVGLTGNTNGGGNGGGPGGGQGGGPGQGTQFSAENDAFIEQAMLNALPASELRYIGYLEAASTKMTTDGIDALSALQEVELQAMTDMQTALDRGTDLAIMIADAPGTVELAAGEVALTFGYSSFTTPLPNQAEWDAIIDSFVASNALVGDVVLDTEMRFDMAEMTENTDCFYLPYNAVTSGEVDSLLNLDPFLSTDATFDRYDLVGNVLPQVQQNNMTYAVPVMIQPSVMRYYPDNFVNVGLATPENGWTSDQFTDALMTLKQLPEDPTPFAPSGFGRFGGGFMQMLIAAYGGLPIDYRTSPATLNFTDPVTVDAIRQVLDLAKEGYIDYSQLSMSGGPGGAFSMGGSGESGESIWTEDTGGLGRGIGRLLGGGRGDSVEVTSQITNYPVGNMYTPVAYGIGTAYISAEAENPQACYEFISSLAQHPELFDGMPARRSYLTAPAYTATVNPDDLAFYQSYDLLIQEPNAVVFPASFSPTQAIGTLLVQNWLNGAFDAYVLEDGDLDAALAEAESFALAFQDCTADMPVISMMDAGSDETYMDQIGECAARIDSSLSGMFGG